MGIGSGSGGRDVGWDEGRWLHPPVRADRTPDGGLLVEPAAGSDLWRHTSYGFVHDDAPALLAPLPGGSAVEVTFRLDYTAQFDQAGVLVRVDERNWVKAGVEVSDGEPQVGAVVTREVSDWSVAGVPGWAGRDVTVRVSRAGDALTVRARADGEPWRLVRVAPLAPDAGATAGPYCCAPTRAGLVVRFASWRRGPADAALHPQG
jgi:regulation of enolase protein 1 (concanavalin A-like superfamily)